MGVDFRLMDTQNKAPRRRSAIAVALVVTIVLGLGSRRFGDSLPDFVAAHAGDALWTLAVFLGFAFLLPRGRTGTLALLALGMSFAVEFSQLVSHPMLDAIRDDRLGALVLGRGFLWIDLVRYAVGTLLGVALDALLLRRKIPHGNGVEGERWNTDGG